MADCALETIGNFNEEELKEFLRNNGMNDCLKVFDLETINGETFLNLSKSDFLRWKNVISSSELKKWKRFLKDVRENPEKFAMPNVKHSTAQNVSPFLQELEKKLTDKGNTLKRNENAKKAKKQIIKSNVQFDGKHPIQLPSNKPKQTEPIYQNVNEHLELKIDKIPIQPKIERAKNGNTEITDFTKSPVKNEGTEVEFRRGKNIESKYYHNMTRSEAESFMKTTKNGDYLFRPSTQHYCALSVHFEDVVRHFGVKSVSGNKLELVTVGDDLKFNSLEDIVRYFKKHPILRTVNSQKTIKLSDPIILNK